MDHVFHQNGTGVYGRLAKLMRRQKIQKVRNVEVGVRLVLSRRRVAVLGGRETLYYDTEKFGMVMYRITWNCGKAEKKFTDLIIVNYFCYDTSSEIAANSQKRKSEV